MSSFQYTEEIRSIAKIAREASRALAVMSTKHKNRCLESVADALSSNKDAIVAANSKDLEAGVDSGLSSARLDRMQLTIKQIEDMSKALMDIIGLEDPVGKVVSTWFRPNGLEIRRITVPIGVVAMVYEARPTIASDAAGLCLKSGNAVILQGSSDCIRTNNAISEAILEGYRDANFPEHAFQFIPHVSEEATEALLTQDDLISLAIPRGSESFIRNIMKVSTIPVLKHIKGVCHAYIDRAANLEMAAGIILNGKQSPGFSNALESLLIDREIAAEFMPILGSKLKEAEIRMNGDDDVCRLYPDAYPATKDDWGKEYLDLTVSVRIVEDVKEAVKHINKYGSGHSEVIISDNKKAQVYFYDNIDSAVVYVNASTRFTNSIQFGMGAEIGVSTDKIHARGPMGIESLTSYKYIVAGDGQVC